MPLLFSFDWPSTTLVLHSFYTLFATLKDGNQQSNPKVPWPLDGNHDRVIIPCCFQSHWILFDVDLPSNLIRQYDSLAGDVSKLADVVSAIKVRLAHAMVGWESRNREFATVCGVSEDSHSFISFLITTESSQASQQQENDSDCGIYMIYNADCLASNRDTLAEQIDDIQLRYRCLERLLDIERRGRSERQMVDMVMSSNKKLRIERRRAPEDISGDEPDPKQLPKKSHRVSWVAPSHLGPQEIWIEERDHLAGISSKDGHRKTVAKGRERAEELLQMIEAIGCGSNEGLG